MDLSSIFKAYDVRGKVGTELTPDTVRNIGRAFADWLPASGPVAVGRDMRPDSAELASALVEGLRSQGRDVIDIGEVTSDMIYFAVGKYDLAGGAVVTASHNPGAYNGIKLYRDKVTPVGLDTGLSQIRDAVIDNIFEPAAGNPGAYSEKNITGEWVEHCLKFAPNLKSFRIAIDAGNGMAGAILPHILPKLPITAQAMYFELDGTFPNHEANPQKPENLQDLIAVVKENGYDFGVAFDGDGDRAAFVDDLGRAVFGTDLISIGAKLYLEKYPGAEIIHEVRTSRATRELITEWGGHPVRTKAGRVHISKVLRERGAPFGGEASGHFFFKENYDADSGLIAALVIMQAISNSGKKLSELIDEYRRYIMLTEANFEVHDAAAVFDELRQTFALHSQDELDGLTVEMDDGWFNLRASNTEPLVRLNAEATTQKRLDEIVAKVSDAVAKH